MPPDDVVPTQLQVRPWRRRQAEAGGALGVRVLTFDRLYAECLTAVGEVYTELSEPVEPDLGGLGDLRGLRSRRDGSAPVA